MCVVAFRLLDQDSLVAESDMDMCPNSAHHARILPLATTFHLSGGVHQQYNPRRLIHLDFLDNKPTSTMAPAPPRPAVKPQKVRYFKGKPVGAVASDSDSDDDEDVVIPKRTVPKIDESLVAGGAGRVIKEGKPIIKMELGSVKVGGDGGVKHGGWRVWAWLTTAVGEESDEESEEESEEELPKPKFVPKLPGGDEVGCPYGSRVTPQSSEYETDSEEESEEEAKPAIRPVFVSK